MENLCPKKGFVALRPCSMHRELVLLRTFALFVDPQRRRRVRWAFLGPYVCR